MDIHIYDKFQNRKRNRPIRLMKESHTHVTFRHNRIWVNGILEAVVV